LLLAACLVACSGGTTPADGATESGTDGAIASDVMLADTGSEAAAGDVVALDAADATVRDVIAADVSDASRSDAGATDTGTVTPDTGSSADVASSCPTELGAPCSGSAECTAGLECHVGRCSPQGRQTCGGFAGARCTDPDYSECLYFSGADFGTCVRPSEARCLCMRAPMAYSSCP
jgi:hypothetical protein